MRSRAPRSFARRAETEMRREAVQLGLLNDTKASSGSGAGVEPRATCVRNVAKRRENDADRATKDDARRREVSASTPMSPDEAIRVAAKLAIDAGDLTRARALLDLLDVESRIAPIAHARSVTSMPMR